MPRIVLTEGAQGDVIRCVRFLLQNSPRDAARVAQVLNERIKILKTMPEIGRPVPEQMPRRELLIPFGSSGYVALYHYDQTADTVYILALRHQKEAGYAPEIDHP